MNGVYLSEDIPEIFKIADASVKSEHKNKPKKMTVVREPDRDDGIIRFKAVAPEVKSSESLEELAKESHNKRKENNKKKKKKIHKHKNGEQKKIKEERRKLKEAQERAEIRAEMIQLMARRNMLNSKLSKLNPGKNKHAKKIADINIELMDIEYRLSYLSDLYGEEVKDVYQGSKFGRFVNKAKKKGKKFIKKFKRFFRKNGQILVDMTMVIAPIVTAIMLL